MADNAKKIVIIGAGPAGYTAAIYAARGGHHPLLIEGLQPGGQLMITNDIENYPGFEEPLPGPTLMTQMRPRESAAKLSATSPSRWMCPAVLST